MVLSAEVISFVVPLPPVMIRSNSRSHWARRVKAKQAYSEAVWHRSIEERIRQRFNADPLTMPWERARVTFTWRACHVPDQANVLGNCKALLDILCCAPKSLQKNETTYLGLIEDDRGVEAIGKVERVAHRADEGVVVRIERLR